ncbi:MAG: DUF2203 domain-containing protein [Gemmatimonadales bacterium]
MPAKLFTLAEANRTLPLVRRVVQDIMAVYPVWKDLVARYELIAAQARPEWGESPEQLGLKAEIDAVATKINGFLQELEQVGCEFKGFDEGLVDFHGRLEEREILWCWKLGEKRISYWHERDAGFAGRQPIPEVVAH